MLIFLLLIAVLCYAAWIYIQMHAFFVASAAVLIFSAVYGIGVAVSKTDTGKKFWDILRAGLTWCFKTPMRIIVSIFSLVAVVLVVLIGYDSAQPGAADFKIEYHKWQIEESFMGVPYDVVKHGYLVTNDGEKPTYVRLKVTQYGKNGNVVEEEELGCNLPAGGSRLLGFEVEKGVTNVDYSIAEIQKPAYKLLNIGYTKDSSVYFCYDEEDTLIVVNNTKEKIKACGAQIVYFNADNKIIAECSAAIGDIKSREQGEKHFYPNYIPNNYERCEVFEWALAK